MPTKEQIVKAFRCCNTPKTEPCYKGCPYLAEGPSAYGTATAFCDCDRIDRDVMELLERQDKYRWHDLRKDPNDLPNHHNMVYVYGYQYAADRNNEPPEYMMDHYVGGWMCGEISSIIAWREIEPFEEEHQ